MNKRFVISGTRIFYSTLAFFSCWYFYFASSFKLRPYAQLFWVAMTGVSIIIAFMHRAKLNRIDMIFMGGMACLILISLFSVDVFASMGVVINYVIYYIVARMITQNCEGKRIHSFIFFFSVVHMICLYVQVLVPNMYTGYILPLLPDNVHTAVIEQMNINAAYYGFSVQTSMSAMYLSIGVILSAIRAKNAERLLKRGTYIVLAVLFLIATFFTQRRGSSAASLVVLALIYMKSKGNKGSKILFGIAIVMLIAVIGVQNIPGVSGVLNKMTTFMATGSVMNGRDDIFMNAIRAILKRPLCGWGGGQVLAAMDYAWLENAYLSILVQWGIIGFFIFYRPYLKILKKTISNLKDEENNYIDFSFYIQILFLIMSMVENYYGDPLNMFIFFVIVLIQSTKQKINTKNISEMYV